MFTSGPAIVIGRKGSFGSIHWEASDCFVIDTAYSVWACDPSTDMRWLYYALQAVDLRGTSQDVGVPGLSRESAYAVEVPTCAAEEQRRIANFLDVEICKVDEIVRQRRVHQTLLKKRIDQSLVRTVLVDHASWSRARLKYLFALVRNGLWGEDPIGDADDVTCVRVADFQRDRYVANPGAPTLRSVPAASTCGRILRPGDVLLEKSGGGEQSPVGFAVTFDSPARSVCSNFMAALRVADGVDSRFACLVLAALYRSGRNVPHIKQSTGIQNLDSGAYLAQEVRVPSSREQVDIAHHFDRQLEETLTLQSLIDGQLGLLAERRQALITAAITGQIDVTTARGVSV